MRAAERIVYIGDHIKSGVEHLLWHGIGINASHFRQICATWSEFTPLLVEKSEA